MYCYFQGVQYFFYNHETFSKFLGQNSVVQVFSKDFANFFVILIWMSTLTGLTRFRIYILWPGTNKVARMYGLLVFISEVTREAL